LPDSSISVSLIENYEIIYVITLSISYLRLLVINLIELFS